MEGVQFLLRNPVYVTEYSWGWCGDGFIVLGSAVFGCWLIWRESHADISMHGIASFFIIILSCLGIALSLLAFSEGKETKVYDHAEYEVIIHEGVDCKEFLENYEIVDVNGDTYTIVIKSELENPKELA